MGQSECKPLGHPESFCNFVIAPSGQPLTFHHMSKTGQTPRVDAPFVGTKQRLSEASALKKLSSLNLLSRSDSNIQFYFPNLFSSN